ncbi:uncharacterized protein BT62DRAFT_964788 [Guyanagaster necrorhizus]|uniref:BTB domain-containing protein n=1 Tax=Guyanagaster necrorhizus TaxID=856835 RepID=A0A9P8AUU1_9AGAR|nr:uncharacterized protein BT62DRAFT_964788 [Guyanagaster necrorhizus MCA 3950]KAG7448416.1 hypothetical protein BT62DRAFT_964788 [Guyanagaster necrorhizus MCA 3950]
MALVVSPPWLQEATKNSTTTWQVDLESLFHHAKDRFPDVVWEVGIDDQTEEVWGHKAIVYARAPPSFQSRYFSFKPNTAPSPLGYSSPVPTTSALSLSLGLDVPHLGDDGSRASSPMRVTSPAPSSMTGTILRLNTPINPALFSNELEYLYTGQGFGEAFEFLFDSPESRQEGDAEELRIDKLRKDLVFMWRSRLYSDVRIELTGTFSSSNPEHTTAIFSSHRFILVSRCSYFHTALISWPSAPSKSTSSDPLALSLPSPPFTPASLHFTLGFIYTGTLVFSHRSYDLDTAFHILRSATYLSLQTLYDEIQARIVQEMMHGLFHAFLEFSEYERITGGKWGTGGCRCRQCARRAPRVLEFALSDDVKNAHLDRGARRALVGLFGEGWCTSEFSALPQKIKDNLLKGVGKRTTPQNVFALLFAAEHALGKINNVIDAWADSVRDMILLGRKTIDNVLASQSDACFSQPDWLELMETDGVRFEDGERVDWIMASVKRGVNDKNAAIVYQTLVSNILLRPHPIESDQAMLPGTSHVRVQVEQTRLDVISWLRKRWLGVRNEGGFEGLEGWAIKEISDSIEISVDDLVKPAFNGAAKNGFRASVNSPKDADKDSDMQSMRVSILSRNLPTRSNASITPSVRSVRTTASRFSVASTSTSVSSPRRKVTDPRPDSKLTPPKSSSPTPTPSLNEPAEETEARTTPSAPLPKKIVGPSSVSSRRSLVSTSSSLSRPKSTASVASVRTVRSHASTVRKSTPVSSLRPPFSIASSRPSSRVSTASTSTTNDGASTAYKTATSRSRKSSTASNLSTSSVRTTKSTASMISKSPSARSPVIKKAPSIAPSIRSTTSTTSTARRSISGTPGKKEAKIHVPPLPKATPKATRAQSLASEHKKTESVSSTSSSASTLKRKGSSDTIKTTSASPKTPPTEPASAVSSTPYLSVSPQAKGATLEIGIPCIISSRRKRFKAYARYIGEVEGEAGSWVGVEVPGNFVGDLGAEWNDGSWGGVRYFDIGGGAGSEWGDGSGSGFGGRRKADWVHMPRNGNGTVQGVKRPAEGMGGRAKRIRSSSPAGSDSEAAESRGLFVRPQQVLYVVDAIDGDL